jgi:hypothetical protein
MGLRGNSGSHSTSLALSDEENPKKHKTQTAEYAPPGDKDREW